MTGARRQPKPTFIWQAILILLPVGILALMGASSLRQDRILAEREASERAQQLADTLAGRITDVLRSMRSDTNSLTFQLDASGNLLVPPPLPGPPAPHPFDLDALTPNQAEQWKHLESQAESRLSGNVAQLCRAFLNSQPPEDFAASALYRLGLSLSAQHQFAEAQDAFTELLDRHPASRGESGLPLDPLARFRRFHLELELSATQPTVEFAFEPAGTNRNSENEFKGNGRLAGADVAALDSLCSNLVHQPTFLTPQLLAMTGRETMRAANASSNMAVLQLLDRRVQFWRQLWERHETIRSIHSAAQPALHGAFALSPVRWTEGGSSTAEATVAPPSATAAPLGHSPAAFWIETDVPIPTQARLGTRFIGDQHWLVLPAANSASNFSFVCFAESELGARFSTSLMNSVRVPDYFGIVIEIAGSRLREFAPDIRLWSYDTVFAGKGSGTKVIRKPANKESSARIALSSGTGEGNIPAGVSVGIYVTSPSALYHTQRVRVRWFTALLLAATGVALIGLGAAWRSFWRQLKLNEMKSNFVSSVSHELRAPIASVRLMAESLDRGKIQAPEKQNEYFKFIVQECRRLSSLIENVLDFSRIEQGRKEYEFEPTNFGALASQTLALMQPYATERGIVLILEIPEPQTTLLEWTADGKAIQQALVNLIDNAVKHSPKGETVTVKITIPTLRRDDPRRDELHESPSPKRSSGTRIARPSVARPSDARPSVAWLELSVSDHGPGIPREDHDRIFERFYRRGSELRRETQGVGIGLNIVKHIVEAHGGRVIVESEPGKGSCFKIQLPHQPVSPDDRKMDLES